MGEGERQRKRERERQRERENEGDKISGISKCTSMTSHPSILEKHVEGSPFANDINNTRVKGMLVG